MPLSLYTSLDYNEHSNNITIIVEYEEILPWKKLRYNWKVGGTSDSTEKKNNIWMTQSAHYPHLAE